MSMKLTFFILSISLAASVNNEPKEPSNKAKDTIEEFGERLGNFVRSFPKAAQEQYKSEFRKFHEKGIAAGFSRGIATGFSRGIATGFSRGIATGEMNMKGAMFSNYFHCFINTIKRDLESAYGYFKEKDIQTGSAIFQRDRAIIHIQDIQPPLFFIVLQKYFDMWMYLGITPPEGFITTTTPGPEFTIKLKSKLQKLIHYYQQWYYIISTFIIEPQKTPAYILQLRIELRLYYQNNIHHYDSYETVKRRFAGQMARSYLMACELHHHRTGQIFSAYEKLHFKKQFSDILLELIPTWHFSEEQFTFLKILNLVLYSGNNLVSNNGGLNLGSYLEFEKIVIRMEPPSLLNEEVQFQWTVIPYVDARLCGWIDIAAHSKNTAPIKIVGLHSSPPYREETMLRATGSDDERWTKLLYSLSTTSISDKI